MEDLQMEDRLRIVLNHLFDGGRINEDDFSYAMDENYDVGVIFMKEDEEVIMGDRLTVGQLFKVVQSMPVLDIINIAASRTIRKEKMRKRRNNGQSF